MLRVLVGTYLGSQTVPISYARNGDARIFNIPKKIEGSIVPVMGGNKKEPVVIQNSGYWISHDVTVGKAETSKYRDFGRVWNFDGRSAEICQIDWAG